MIFDAEPHFSDALLHQFMLARQFRNGIFMFGIVIPGIFIFKIFRMLKYYA